MGKLWKKILGIIPVFSRGVHLFFSFGGSCRFEPTCSNYCAQSIGAHGVFKGLWLSGKRLLKCHPLGGWGFDHIGQKVG